MNMSNLFLGMIIILTGLFAIIALYPWVNIYQKAETWSNKIKKTMLWEPVLRFFNESYLILSISVFINLAFFDFDMTKGETFSYILALVLLLGVVIGYPLFNLLFPLLNYEKLKYDNMRERFGSIYLVFNYKQGKIKLMEPFYSTVRRLFMALILIFLRDYPTF